MSKAKNELSNGFKTVKLDTPIVRGEQTVTEVTLRKPGTGEMRGISLTDLLKLDVDTLISVIPRVTTPVISKQEAAELDLADTIKLGGEIGSFFLSKEQQELYRNE